jgi:hypothetical protein
MIRGDLSECLIHLTRGVTHDAAAEVFLQIIKSRQLLGSSRDIRGGYKCICFTEAPISILAQSLSLPPEEGMRYAPFGVMVKKQWLFAQGGRPVIYQPEEEFELLSEPQRFRHVRFDPNKGPDYTWEREWRVRADFLPLNPAEVTFVVPTRDWEERFLREHARRESMKSWFDSDMAMYIAPSPWHFIVLEDLGLSVLEQDEP